MKIAFIIQRYGEEIIGGGETFARILAENLHKQYEIEVITTSAGDYQTWLPAYEVGISCLHGITIRRFPIAAIRDINRLHMQEERIYHSNHVYTDEINWAALNGPYTPELIRYIRENQKQYDIILFFTFRYFHSFAGISAVPEKAVLIPFAENEPSLYLNITKSLFSLVKGIIFVTPEEEQIVKSALGIRHFSCPNDVIPIGIDLPKENTEDNRKNQYILYLGRIEPAKGCSELFSYYIRMKDEGFKILPLVVAGPKAMEIPNHPDIHYIGVVSEEKKEELIRGATFLIMPSPYESLSLITLEAWAHNTPVLVNGSCKVLTGHCIRCNGGLWYDSYDMFVRTVSYLLENPQLCKSLGRSGNQYVKEQYNWEAIMQKYQHFFERIQEQGDINGASA